MTWCLRGASPALSERISRRFGCLGLIRAPDGPGPWWGRGARGDLGPAFGPGHLPQGQGFQFGGQFAEPAGAGEPGRVGVVLDRGEDAGDGLAFDGAGPLDVGAVQGGRVGLAGAGGLAAAGAADDDAAGQAEADAGEGCLDRCPGLVCAAVVWGWRKGKPVAGLAAAQGGGTAGSARSRAMAALVLRRLSRFADTRGVPAGWEFLLDYDVIEAFCVTGLRGRASSTQGTYRSALYRLAQGAPGPGRQPGPAVRAAAADP